MTQNTIYVRNTKDKEKKPAIVSKTKPFFGTPFTSLQPPVRKQTSRSPSGAQKNQR